MIVLNMPKLLDAYRLDSTKKVYKKSLRVDAYVKGIIEKNFREVCRKTGFELSYGEIVRAFWVSIAENPEIRRECIRLVCGKIVNDKKKKALYYESQRHR